MKLQDQVCNLELAKKLKELGVKQESLFWWARDHDEKEAMLMYGKPSGLYYGGSSGDNAVWMGYHDRNTDFPNEVIFDKNKPADLFSAFTVAELGEMLPIKMKTVKKVSGKYSCWISALPTSPVMESQNEADARAKMLIYLLENKIITP